MAMNAYMKIESIGTNNTPATIDILSFQWGVGRASDNSTGGGGGAGKVSLHDITITKTTDSASPPLLIACANGQHLGNAEISILLPAVQDSGGQEYLKYEFTDVLVSEFQAGGNFGGSPLPVETLKFEFGHVAILLPAVQ